MLCSLDRSIYTDNFYAANLQKLLKYKLACERRPTNTVCSMFNRNFRSRKWCNIFTLVENNRWINLHFETGGQSKTPINGNWQFGLCYIFIKRQITINFINSKKFRGKTWYKWQRKRTFRFNPFSKWNLSLPYNCNAFWPCAVCIMAY